jgi:hypothetical protein
VATLTLKVGGKAVLVGVGVAGAVGVLMGVAESASCVKACRVCATMLEIWAIPAGVFVGALAGEVPKSTEILHARVASARTQNRARSIFTVVISLPYGYYILPPRFNILHL